MTKEALKSAIEFAEYCLEELDLSHMASNQAKRLVQKSKEALAQPEHEPFAWFHYLDFRMIHHEVWLELIEGQGDWIPLYTTTPQRTWVGLSEEEVEACFHHVDEAGIGLFDFAEAIEAKLKEKNT